MEIVKANCVAQPTYQDTQQIDSQKNKKMKKLIQELQDLAISLAAEHIELGNEIKTHKNRIDIYMEQNNLSGDIGDSKTIRKLQQDHSNFFEKISSDLHQTRLKEIYAAAKLQLLVEHVIPLIEKYNAE